jgi:hypothetical protein
VSARGDGEVGHTRVADELASLLRPVGALFSRRRAEIVLGIAVLVTALVGFAVLGAALDDRTITAHQATAQAELLGGSSWARTLVRFTVAGGEVRVPANGVFYPWGLQPGSAITVEYDVTNPDLVRVAGQGALGNAGPLMLVMVVTWLLLGPLAHRLRRRSR